MDPWRVTFPETRLFSGPDQRNRIDYCLVTTDLFDTNYQGSRYVTEKKWLHEDHYPVPLVRTTLAGTLDCLAKRLRWFPGSNPGILLDEDKAADRQFLQEMQRALKNKDDKCLASLRKAVRMAKALDAACSSDATRKDLTDARSTLQAQEDFFADRRENTKFDRTVTEGEHGSAYFFRSPTTSAHSVTIPNVTLPDGTTTDAAVEMAEAHLPLSVSLVGFTRNKGTSSLQSCRTARHAQVHDSSAYGGATEHA
ncbi:hypothetical protein PHYPSEUDO_000657 [Phytophthora pseudosyringae]|uniref:Uncharacterized protein n=1 Tax=Phytophthora pseudosyringae TaxID=221518 RepID=A0A8T1V7K5_9STRA|nr:hypothetical protein PHYPSEUDO_000657 [Phytophthora pseudosyringae]